MRDYYAVLGVAKTSSQDEIKKAFHTLAKQYHPDLNKTPGAAERFKEINEAYQILGDPEKRQEYEYNLEHPPKQEKRTWYNPSPNPYWTREDEEYYQSIYKNKKKDTKAKQETKEKEKEKEKAKAKEKEKEKEKKKPDLGTPEDFREFRDKILRDYDSIFDLMFGKSKDHGKVKFDRGFFRKRKI